MLKELLKENAAGGGGCGGGTTAGSSIAVGGGSNYPSEKKTKKNTKKNTKMIKRPLFSFKSYMGESEEDRTFDPSDVIAKLKSAEKKASTHDEETTAFVLEDEDENLVKVWVPDDQADDFQQSLEQALSHSDEDDDDQNSQKEIAEILWDLKDDFDIVNIEWGGEIPEDQEEAVPADATAAGETGEPMAGGAEGDLEAGAEGQPGEEGDMTAEPGEEGELGLEAGGDEAGAETALQSVIAAMKADSEARAKEAEAKAAEAQARSAEAALRQAELKLKSEEETLDAEAYYDDKKKEEDESKRLSKLAQWKHDMAKDKGQAPSYEKPPEEDMDMGGGEEDMGGDDIDMDIDMDMGPPDEEEEEVYVTKRPKTPRYNTHLSKTELADMYLRSLRGKY